LHESPRNNLLVTSQLFIGGAVAILCGIAFRYDQWFIHSTPKGSRLKEMFGEARAVWVWRTILLAGVAFGACLATGMINPMTWNR